MWYVVRFGEILFVGTEEECVRMISEDNTGEIEIYPERTEVVK